jgi:hypothetical protein
MKLEDLIEQLKKAEEELEFCLDDEECDVLHQDYLIIQIERLKNLIQSKMKEKNEKG